MILFRYSSFQDDLCSKTTEVESNIPINLRYVDELRQKQQHYNAYPFRIEQYTKKTVYSI